MKDDIIRPNINGLALKEAYELLINELYERIELMDSLHNEYSLRFKEQARTIEESDRIIEELDRAIEENDRNIQEQHKRIIELEKQLSKENGSVKD